MSAMELNMSLSQKQVLSQHMVQSMEILQLSAQELESYIENLSMENPVIELAENHASASSARQEDLQRKLDWLESTDYQNRVYYQADRSAESQSENWYDHTESEESLSEYLLSQMLLNHYSEQDYAIIEFMVLSLNDQGYFTDDLSVVCNKFQISAEHAEKMLSEIQALDPAGVAARNLKECLLLQLRRSKLDSPIAEAVIEHHLEDIARNHLKEITRKLNISYDEIMDICKLIRSFNPKPGSSFSSREQLRYISPDAVVIKLENQFEILINEYQYPKFNISAYYQELQQTTSDAETKKYLSDKIQQAKWVSGCIEQRTSTLSSVMHALVDMQHDFFLNGPGHKHPLRLSDIAKEVHLHESTISRTLRSKYLRCSWGVFPLSYFLTSAATKSSADSNEKTPEQVKSCIQKIIDSEDKQKPYSDQAISQKLEESGIHISRRTVNKYRTEMNLPDKSGRKNWA